MPFALLKQLPVCSTILFEERLLTLLSVHAAKGQTQEIKHDWKHLPSDWHEAGVEAVLQTHLFIGFPRAINAFSAIHEVGISKDVSPQVWVDMERNKWMNEGEKNCEKIYGKIYPSLRRRMKELHPVLDAMMIEHGYGRIIGRPGLSLRLRELCVLSILTGQRVAPQLDSHIRGAYRVGATKEEITTIIESTKVLWDEASYKEASTVLERALK